MGSKLSRMKRLVLLLLSLLAWGLSLHALDQPSRHLPSDNQTSQYDLSVRILPDRRRIEVTGKWKLPPASTVRNQIEFYLSPKMEGLKVQLLEPKISAPLNLQSNQEEGGDTKWIFKPGLPIPAGQSVLLQFSYTSDGKSAPQFNISSEGSFAGGGGELWYPQAAFKLRETGTLRFIVPPGQRVIANGSLRSTPEQKARGEYIFHVTQPSKFGFASGQYTVITRPGRVPFNLYLLRPRAGAQRILDGCARALNLLTNLFGAFPYGEFSLVEVNFPTIVVGTSEFGFILADDSKLDEFDLAYWAHEMGHQWWGNAVRSASGTTGQMMLSEGVTQFGALQAVEAVEGQRAAEQFRRDGYHAKGHSAASYFHLIQSGTDLPLTSYLPKNQNETLTMHRIANTKGFILLEMLSRRIGREIFNVILRRFIRQKANQTTSWQEFRQMIETGAGQDIRWFFEQWFERTGAPDYQLTWVQEDGALRVTISQPAPYFRAALEVEVSGSGGHRLLKTVEVANGRTEFNWKIPFKVSSVVLDPHYKVLRWLPEFHSRDMLKNH
jgi:Peptidase family M1 domain